MYVIDGIALLILKLKAVLIISYQYLQTEYAEPLTCKKVICTCLRKKLAGMCAEL